MQVTNVVGLQIPHAGPVFLTALAIHVIAALTCLIAGLIAAIAPKRPGRHPTGGRVYLSGLTVVTATAMVMAGIRWREDARLFAIAVVALGLGLLGWRARRRQRPGWPLWHASGMGGSYIALLTGFYVDNGPQLPVWRLMPHWLYWTLPAAIGAPLIWWALRRYRADVSQRPHAAERSGS